MLAFRSLARSVPRATTQFAARAAVRQPSLLSRATFPNIARISPVSRFAAAFSSSSRWRSDEELVAKLASEIQVEQDHGSGNSQVAEREEALQSFLSKGWTVEDNAGEEDVALIKQEGNETIRISFSISDINNESDSQFDYPEDPLEEESGETPQNEQSREEALEEREYTDDQDFPVKLSIQVTKAEKPGAILVEATVRDGLINIDEFFYLKDASLAEPKTFEAEKARLDQFFGPPFVNLDEELQTLVEKYLQERGINEELASFVVDYIETKEPKEYIQWLQNVRDFVA